MNVTLVMLEGETRARQFRLKSVETVIGRRKGCGLRINAHDVSRRHCRVRLQGQQVSIRDLGSANGTYVNGKPLTGERIMRPGDRVRVGPISFIVEFIDPAMEPLEAIALDDVILNEGFVEVGEIVVLEENQPELKPQRTPGNRAVVQVDRARLRGAGIPPGPLPVQEPLPCAELDEPMIPFAPMNPFGPPEPAVLPPSDSASLPVAEPDDNEPPTLPSSMIPL